MILAELFSKRPLSYGFTALKLSSPDYRVRSYGRSVLTTSIATKHLNDLLLISKQDPPTEWEIQRNQKIKAIQGNGNPFVEAYMRLEVPD